MYDHWIFGMLYINYITSWTQLTINPCFSWMYEHWVQLVYPEWWIVKIASTGPFCKSHSRWIFSQKPIGGFWKWSPKPKVSILRWSHTYIYICTYMEIYMKLWIWIFGWFEGTSISGHLPRAVFPHFQTDPGIKIRGSVGCEPLSAFSCDGWELRWTTWSDWKQKRPWLIGKMY